MNKRQSSRVPIRSHRWHDGAPARPCRACGQEWFTDKDWYVTATIDCPCWKMRLPKRTKETKQ